MKKKIPYNQPLLNESFYREKDSQGDFNSIKQFIQKYLAQHEIDALLKQAFQDVLQADRLPKNLYAGLYRNISLKVYQKNQEQYFQEIQDKKMLTNKVTTQERNLKAQLSADSDTVLHATPSLLTYISRTSTIEVIKFFKNKSPIEQDSRVHHIITAYGGSYVLKNQFLCNTFLPSRNIQQSRYVIMTGKPDQITTIFAELIYAQVLHFIKTSNAERVFEKLQIEQLSLSELKASYIWKRSDILLYKIKLIKEISKAISQSAEILIRTLQNFNGRYLYIDRRYMLVSKDENQHYDNFQIYPMCSAFRSVFTSKQDYDMYLNICQGMDQQLSDIDKSLLDLYVASQCSRIMKYLYVHETRMVVWELYLLCIVESEAVFTQILDEIVYNILTGFTAEIYQIHIELEIFIERLMIQLFREAWEIESTLDDILSRLRNAIDKGRNPDLLRFREVIGTVSREALETVKNARKKNHLRSLVKFISLTIKQIVMNCDQIELGLNNKKFKQLLVLIGNVNGQHIVEMIKYFQDIQKQKSEPLFVDLKEETKRLKSEYNIKSDKEASDLVITMYLKQYNFFENLYSYYIQMFFGNKPRYPLASLMSQISQFCFYSAYFDEPHTLADMQSDGDITSVKLNNLNVETLRYEGIDLVGFQDNLRFANVEEIKRLREMADLLKIDKSEMKIPGNIEVNELFSISGEHLLTSSSHTQQVICNIYLNVDVVVRGAVQKQYDNLIYDIVASRCKKLQSQSTIGVIGLYDHKDSPAVSRIWQVKMPPTVDQWKRFIESVDSLYLRCVMMTEQRIKVLSLLMNFHMVKQEDDKSVTSIHKLDSFHCRHRIFFSMNDMMIWTRYIPQQPQNTRELLFHSDLDMNACIKRYILSSLQSYVNKSEELEKIEAICQVLYFDSQRLHFLSLDVLNFYYMLQYMKKDRTGKFQIKHFSVSLQITIESIMQFFLKYDYSYNQGLSVAIFQYCQHITKYMESHQNYNGQERQLVFLEQIVYSLYEVLLHNSHTMHIEYRNTLKRSSPKLTLII